MYQRITLLLLLLSLLPLAQAQSEFAFDSGQNRWHLSNGVVDAQFTLTPEGLFRLDYVRHLGNGDVWAASGMTPSSPIKFTLDDVSYGARTSFKLIQQWQETTDNGTLRQVIELEDSGARARIRLVLEMYPRKAVLRYYLDVSNLQGKTVYVRAADMLPWRFDDAERETYRWFRVNQWAIVPQQGNFEPLQNTLDPAGSALTMQSGARGMQCGWWALRAGNDRGMFAGWEFDGRATASVRQFDDERYLQLSASIDEFNHPLAPGESFRVPAAFIGLFHGDWDEAGYRTQRFVENVLAKPMPDPSTFPFIAWDSWGYQQEFNEDLLKRNADIAAKLGFELFTVDLGWARKLGDWHSNRDKFPSGMQSLSDYVHSLGMKFGLHFALAEAAADAPVLLENPDWTTSEDYNYFGAKSLCLSNRPTRDWIIDEAVRMIQTYNVDWVLQDGENMVKSCTKTTHTHDPKDSNYANAVEGLDYVLREIQRRTPNTVWENCENGGNMMTFNMVQNYVTSITNDASGALGARQAVYGATYPFPPRYVDRYMPDNSYSSYITRSFVFGGPWILMNRLEAATAEETKFLGGEIQAFKKIRKTVRDGKVFHITERPGATLTDAIQAYDPATKAGVAVVTRDGTQADYYVFRPRGLDPAINYRVTFQDDSRTLLVSGEALMRSGVQVSLPGMASAEIVYVEPEPESEN